MVTVRVLHEVDGRRQVVSHFNKATKGRIVRAAARGRRATRARRRRSPTLLADLGWSVEVGPASQAGTRLDVVVSEL